MGACVCMHACSQRINTPASWCVCYLFACKYNKGTSTFSLFAHLCVSGSVAFVKVSGEKPTPPLAPQGFTNSQRSQTQWAPASSWPHLKSPSLCFCHALKPLEGLLPAINVTTPSYKINGAAATSQMRSSKIRSSIFLYLLSLWYEFFSPPPQDAVTAFESVQMCQKKILFDYAF